jgi:sulfite exporter TauE/SafE
MKCNVGKVDRTIRIIAGLAIIGVGVYYNNWWGAIGAVPLITALIGWCPAYSLIGVSTCGIRDKL